MLYRHLVGKSRYSVSVQFLYSFWLVQVRNGLAQEISIKENHLYKGIIHIMAFSNIIFQIAESVTSKQKFPTDMHRLGIIVSYRKAKALFK